MSDAPVAPLPTSLPGRLAGRARQFLESFFGDPVFRKKLRFLRSVVLFKDLPSRDLARIVKQIMEKTYGPGDVVFQEGDVGRAFFIVAEGRVEVLRRNTTSGEMEPVAQFGPGDFLAEMVLLDELPRASTCRAVETAHLYVMYKDIFDHLRIHFPRAAAPILYTLGRLLSARLRREHRVLPRVAVPKPPVP